MNSRDELSFSDLISIGGRLTSLVVQKRWVVLRWTAVASIVGLTFALTSPVEYAASIRLLPYRGSPSGGLTGLAGLAGVRLSGGSADQAITSELYPELIAGVDYRIAVAEAPLRFATLPEKSSAVEYFRVHSNPTLLGQTKRYTTALPAIFFKKRPSIRTEDANRAPGEVDGLRSFNPEYLSLINAIGARVVVGTDRRTSVISISTKMPDPVAAADLARVSADRLVERIRKIEARRATEQFEFVEQKRALAEQRYERAQRLLAEHVDRNRVTMSAVADINRQRLQNEHDLSFELLQQLSREQEQARLKINQDTPVFAVLEDASVPTHRSEPRRTRIVLFFTLIGLLIGSARVVVFGLKDKALT